jgi:hypothetical protein
MAQYTQHTQSIHLLLVKISVHLPFCIHQHLPPPHSSDPSPQSPTNNQLSTTMARPKRNRRVAATSTSEPALDSEPVTSVRLNYFSILRNIDLASIPTIRALMSCLAADPPSPITLPNVMIHIKNFGLPSTAAGPVYRIFCAVRDNGEYDLLKRAVGRFTEANKGSDEDVSAAVQELEDLAEEMVLRYVFD